jgi:hypothetical protein
VDRDARLTPDAGRIYRLQNTAKRRDLHPLETHEPVEPRALYCPTYAGKTGVSLPGWAESQVVLESLRERVTRVVVRRTRSTAAGFVASERSLVGSRSVGDPVASVVLLPALFPTGGGGG